MKIIIEKLSYPNERLMQHQQLEHRPSSLASNSALVTNSVTTEAGSDRKQLRKRNSSLLIKMAQPPTTQSAMPTFDRAYSCFTNRSSDLFGDDDDELKLMRLKEEQRALNKKIELVATNIYAKNHLSHLDDDEYYEDNDDEENFYDYDNNELLLDGDDSENNNEDEFMTPRGSHADNHNLVGVARGGPNSSLFQPIQATSRRNNSKQPKKNSGVKSVGGKQRNKKDRKQAIKRYLLQAIFQQQKLAESSNLNQMQKYKSDSQLLSVIDSSVVAGPGTTSSGLKQIEKTSSSSRFLDAGSVLTAAGSATSTKSTREAAAASFLDVPTKSEINKNFMKFTIDFKNIRKKLTQGGKAIKRRSFYGTSSATTGAVSSSIATTSTAATAATNVESSPMIPLIKVEAKSALTVVAGEQAAVTSGPFCTVEVKNEGGQKSKKPTVSTKTDDLAVEKKAAKKHYEK
jgi:hypothetical protein